LPASEISAFRVSPWGRVYLPFSCSDVRWLPFTPSAFVVLPPLTALFFSFFFRLDPAQTSSTFQVLVLWRLRSTFAPKFFRALQKLCFFFNFRLCSVLLSHFCLVMKRFVVRGFFSIRSCLFSPHFPFPHPCSWKCDCAGFYAQKRSSLDLISWFVHRVLFFTIVFSRFSLPLTYGWFCVPTNLATDFHLSCLLIRFPSCLPWASSLVLPLLFSSSQFDSWRSHFQLQNVFIPNAFVNPSFPPPSFFFVF